MALISYLGHALEVALGWVYSPNWLPPKDFQFLKWLLVPGFGYGCVLIGIAIVELIRPAQRRPWGRATALSATYWVFAGKMAFYGLVVTPIVRKAWLYFHLPSFHLDRALPLVIYMPLAALVVTFTAYWAHRLMHRIPALWHIHKIHHSATNLNWSTIYHKHFLELLLQTPTHLAATLLLGTDLVAPFGIIFMTIDVFGHSNVRADLGFMSYLFSTPEAHRIHHSNNPQHFDTNFGNTIMLWDHLFGTFHYDPQHPPTGFGIDEPLPQSFVQQQVLPLYWIGKGGLRWVRDRMVPGFLRRPGQTA